MANTIMDLRDTEFACSRPKIYYGRILLGEISPLLAAMRKAAPRWSSHQVENEKDPLVQKLKDLQRKVINLEPNEHLEPSIFLEPFLAIIRSGNNTGPVTKRALAAINRMLCYGLISAEDKNAVAAVESIADTVTHARFVGSDPGSDEVVLWEILTVLHTLILGPVGYLLTNESVCEIFNSSFRICFETRLSELLRTCTEDTLHHMVQLLFARLPQFKDDPLSSHQTRRLKMHTGNGNEAKDSKSRKKQNKDTPPSPSSGTSEGEEVETATTPSHTEHAEVSLSPALRSSSAEALTEITSEPTPKPPPVDSASVDSGINDMVGEPLDVSQAHLAPENAPLQGSPGTPCESPKQAELDDKSKDESEENTETPSIDTSNKENSPSDDDKNEFINQQGVTFTQEGIVTEENVLTPYGLPCVREVLRFLISLTLPTNEQNSTTMIHTALNLLTVALEVGAEHISNAPSLISLVKDQLCHNLFSLLKADAKPTIFLASLRVCTLLFESLRHHLKFQLEMFIGNLVSIVSSDIASSYVHKELSLEAIVLLWRFPGLAEELFMNFDCNLYSSNAFEELIKILSKNAYPIQGLYSTNLLCLEAFLTLTSMIDSHCSPPSSYASTDKAKNIVESSHKFPAVVTPSYSGFLLGAGLLGGYSPITPVLKMRDVLTGCEPIDRESLLVLKEKKRLITAGTDHFNSKPEKGIHYLQNNGIIGASTEDIALFLKENSHLDKQVLGEYLSKKKNVDILSAFVKSLDFRELRIDECLRTFLEAFRLPGEAPLISIVIEHFSSHWHTTNGSPFGKEDAAFTLAYAVIMLNVDQHNQNAKKQNIPMTLDQFRFNLRGVNNGSDFDPKMLEEIYFAIRGEEIVMPAEHTGLVKDNYLWKMLLKRGKTKEGEYLLSTGDWIFDKDLFSISGRPTIASLSYLFDKSVEDALAAKAIHGFEMCASISARFGMSDIFDILIVTLCKFSTLTSSGESHEQVGVSFGANLRAQFATRTLFNLVINYGDILCDGWKNIIELLLHLFRCRLLPTVLVESEDFVEPSGKVCLLKEDAVNIPRVESGLLSSLYSYISLGDGSSPRSLSSEDLEFISKAKACLLSCHPEKILSESAFLRYDSLNELLKAMIVAGSVDNIAEFGSFSGTPLASKNLQSGQDGIDENSQAFLLELLVSVLVANKDRAGGIWPGIRDHIYSILMGAAATERNFLLERCVVVILRVAKVLLRRRELANLILQSLRMFLLLRSHILNRVALQVVAGIHEILALNADHIHHQDDWTIIYTLLECAGAGAKPPPIVSPDSQEESLISDHTQTSSAPDPDSASGIEHPQGTLSGEEGRLSSSLHKPPTSASSDGTTSGSETNEPPDPKIASPTSTGEPLQNPGGWILVGREGEIEPVPVRAVSVNEWDIVHQRILGEHLPDALVKAVDTLSFLVRDGHITPASLSPAVQACRTFVEATLNGGKIEKKPSSNSAVKSPTRRRGTSRGKKEDKQPKRPTSPATSSTTAYEADESDPDDMPLSYLQASEKLLDLMDTLHTSSSRILDLQMQDEKILFSAESLWHMALCPLLQGIARYCCDIRATIRSLGMTYLQRALLNHDLQTLSAIEWEGCFNKVLFPLLAKLLQPMPANNFGVLEETRLRAATLVQKVYLRHLTTLLTLPTFTALWLTILDFMDKYLNTHRSDHLCDAVPEILKNMLLVMETTQVFHTSDGFTNLWSITWDRIDAFLPDFRHELFKSHPPSEIHKIELASTETSTTTSVPDDKISKCEPNVAPEIVSKDLKNMEEGRTGEQDDHQDISLKEQAVVRLSLSQECLPSLESNVILQPPLPHLYPITPSSSPPSEPQDLKVSLLSSGVPQPQELSSALRIAHIPPYIPLPVTVLVTPSSSDVVPTATTSIVDHGDTINSLLYAAHSVPQTLSIHEPLPVVPQCAQVLPLGNRGTNLVTQDSNPEFQSQSANLGTFVSTIDPEIRLNRPLNESYDPESGTYNPESGSYDSNYKLILPVAAAINVKVGDSINPDSGHNPEAGSVSPELLYPHPQKANAFNASSLQQTLILPYPNYFPTHNTHIAQPTFPYPCINSKRQDFSTDLGERTSDLIATNHTQSFLHQDTSTAAQLPRNTS